MKKLPDVIHRPDLMKPPPLPKASVGLGDAVAAIANPIAVLVDKTTGSKLSGCGACGQRRDALNKIVPNILKPFTR